MTKYIDLGNVKLPANDFVERATGLIAKRGKGKSGLLKVIEEELLNLELPFVIFDPTGIHWGIKSSFNGKKPSGYKVLVIGGPHGDLPLDRQAGRIVAKAVANTNTSLIVDFKGSSHAVYRQFVADFADELLDINQIPRLLILEEAPRLLPQKLRLDQTASFDAVARLILEGRNSGLGCILVSQRAATVNKDVLTQVDNMIVMGLTGPQDRKAIKEWVEENADPELLSEFINGLSELQTREAWLWSPDMNLFKKFRVKDFTTFHPDRTHLRRMGMLESKVIVTDTKQLVETLGKELVQLVSDAKLNDPVLLKKEIARLKREGTIIPNPVHVPIETIKEVKVEVQTFRDGEVEKLQASAQKLIEFGNSILLKIKSPVPGPVISLNQPPTRIPVPLKHKPLLQNLKTIPEIDHVWTDEAYPRDKKKMGKAEKSILKVLAQYPDGRTMNQIAVLAGYAVSGGGFTNALSACRTNGYMTGENTGTLSITQQGLEYIGNDWEPLPTGSDLQKYWMDKLPHAERSILKTLVMFNYPKEMTLDFIAENTMSARGGPYEVSGGGFTNAISGLRTRELVTGRSMLRASDTLFD